MKGPHHIEKNRRDGDKKPKGIPCPNCGRTDSWATRNTRQQFLKIVRVRVCIGTKDHPGCGHSIRTREVIESTSAA